MNTFLTEILARRGIAPEAQHAFINPDFLRDTHSPFLMLGMEAAVQRVIQARERGEKVTVFGDYDADGIPATAVLVRAFKRIGIPVVPRIPTRAAGYGLQMDVVEEIIQSGTQLLITVDNGTVAKAEIALLKEKGVDTIVCDHHEPQLGHQAEALAVLNPKQPTCPYPFKELCGCAIAWKLAWAVYERLGEDSAQLKWELDLVGLATVADMVPLVGENRVLAIFGLKVLQKTRNSGLRALAESASIDLARVTAGDIGYRLAPRLNAPSRMHKEIVEGENVSLRLLLTENSLEAQTLAGYVQEQNMHRQALLEAQLKEARAQAERFAQDLILVVYDPHWSSGVIGLVAGRLTEQYARPVIVLAKEGEVIKGSVRSIEGADVGSLLQSVASCLERFGGHAKAGGLTLKGDASIIPLLRQMSNEWGEKLGLTLEKMRKTHQPEADGDIPLEAVTLELAEELDTLAPFGIDFPEPILASTCQITGARAVGSTGAHLSCLLRDGLTQKKAVGFGLGETAVSTEELYKVLYTIQKEEWQGRVSVACHIRRLEKVGTAAMVGI